MYLRQAREQTDGIDFLVCGSREYPKARNSDIVEGKLWMHFLFYPQLLSLCKSASTPEIVRSSTCTHSQHSWNPKFAAVKHARYLHQSTAHILHSEQIN